MSNKIKDRDCREKDVKGMITDGHRFTMTNVVVRMTSDIRGKSLSLNAGNILIEIPLEEVEDIIVLAEKLITGEREGG